MTMISKASLAVGVLAGAIACGAIGLGLVSGLGRGQTDTGIVSTLNSTSTIVRDLNSTIVMAKPTARAEMLSDKAVHGKIDQPRQSVTGARNAAWDFKVRSEAVQKIEHSLTEPTELAFVDSPLSEALSVLSEQYQIQILIDKEMLSAASIATDQPVSLFISGVSLRSGLKLLLEPLLLDYVIKNEVLLITTMEGADEIMETRVYNVARIPHLTPRELAEIIVGGSSADGHGGGFATGGGAGAGTVPGGAGGVGGSASGGSSQPVMASNGSLILNSKWEERDGEGGTAWAGKTTLIIRQTQRVHHEIVELLNQLVQEEAAPTKAGR